VTNQDGDFAITLHDSLSRATIHFSHIGYRSLEIAAVNFAERLTILTLEPAMITLPEVSVQAINAKNVLQDYFKNRPENYSKTPVYMDVFYREGIEQEKGSTELVEAVFKMYKDGYNFSENNSFFNFTSTDMVKLEKMRTMVFEPQNKFVNFEIKSGIRSLILLDIVKSTPDFLDPNYYDYFDYAHENTTFVDDKRIYAISFRPKPNAEGLMYKGSLYFDAESKALVMARFEVCSKQLKTVEKMLVLRKDRTSDLSLKGAVYTVLYKEFDGIYHFNYARVDLNLNSRRKRSFSNRTIHCWIEMVCTDMTTTDVKPFARNERFPTHTIFSKTKHLYDFSFWDTYRIITPEERFLRIIDSTDITE
jgi:hypothetical protein